MFDSFLLHPSNGQAQPPLIQLRVQPQASLLLVSHKAVRNQSQPFAWVPVEFVDDTGKNTRMVLNGTEMAIPLVVSAFLLAQPHSFARFVYNVLYKPMERGKFAFYLLPGGELSTVERMLRWRSEIHEMPFRKCCRSQRHTERPVLVSNYTFQQIQFCSYQGLVESTIGGRRKRGTRVEATLPFSKCPGCRTRRLWLLHAAGSGCPEKPLPLDLAGQMQSNPVACEYNNKSELTELDASFINNNIPSTTFLLFGAF